MSKDFRGIVTSVDSASLELGNCSSLYSVCFTYTLQYAACYFTHREVFASDGSELN